MLRPTIVALAVATAVRVGSAGVTVVLPHGWHSLSLVTLRSQPSGTDPFTRVVVASGPISFGNGCGVFPYSFPSTGVAVVVMEWTQPYRGTVLPPRPRAFTARTLPVRPAPAVECFDGPVGSAQFVDHGRRFDAFVLLGRHARAKLADEARAVLDTLRVRRRQDA